MPLGLNEILDRAAAFSREWKHETNEDAEAKKLKWFLTPSLESSTVIAVAIL